MPLFVLFLILGLIFGCLTVLYDDGHLGRTEEAILYGLTGIFFVAAMFLLVLLPGANL